MPFLDLSFPVLGATLSSDHAYPLYAALSRRVGVLHKKEFPIRIGPVSGQYAGNGVLHLDRERSRLRLRLPAEEIPQVLPLAGQSLDVAGHQIRLGVPNVQALVPAPALAARTVTIKGFTTPAEFLAAVQRQLTALDIHGTPALPLVLDGPHAGKPRRRVLRIKDRKIIGFSLHVTELTAAESLRLQDTGLGGRPRLGCGFFVPLVPRRNS